MASRPACRTLTEDELYAELATGRFRRVVICTGAGVSTAAGVADFRSKGGLFDAIRAKYAARFPDVLAEPERLLSRQFVREHPQVWREEVQPWLRQWKAVDAVPTATHRFCAWLHRQGWLRRVYTQNVDGLHSHASLDLPAELVVEVHGALRDGSIVLYGDALPRRVIACASADFHSGNSPDLVLVFGTALQVAPFCALPNLAPVGCTRVLVNRDLSHALRNAWSTPARRGGLDAMSGLSDGGLYGSGASVASSTKIGGRHVTLRPRWDVKEEKRWRQRQQGQNGRLGRATARHRGLFGRRFLLSGCYPRPLEAAGP